ncbi:c-type cytochrome biogenesis protein CcsB [Planosporangium flavigriseum]|uniref:C-type cytochrome biogenesis protein CcsB n=1 Tax=Planosporangium flavigriseum TaxID=373681 RepID=A0A8J3LM77_9ACTN|nr:c-type cytochrome biogenesis protein CcsB [Planosporangium flavigriseum]NJC64363.1 c-type cytochrome biogenesis protein CcsB [Planosporangium flavigriseum]GIG73889.1 c-type cytochrome biogenesis protein CcsB [Planosporangium flavigriseum]
MSALSDQLLIVTVLAYLAAMIGYAAEFSFGTRGVVARAATRARERELVTVGGPADAPVSPAPPAAPVQETPRGRAALVGRLAVALTAVGYLAHLATIVTRGLAANRVPWGNMYEFVLVVCFAGATAWLVLLSRRPAVRPLGLFVTLAEIVMLLIAGMRLHTEAGPLMPALNSYWLKIHVSAAAIASGVLLVGFVAAVLTLLRLGHDKGKRSFPFTLGQRLPDAQTLERLTFRVHAFAFPIWTFAIICGAIWAREAWTQYWSWDPKETWSFISWVIYAGYLHARATPSVKKTVATWIAILGWATMMINLFAINLVVTGMHSYAGVK